MNPLSGSNRAGYRPYWHPVLNYFLAREESGPRQFVAEFNISRHDEVHARDPDSFTGANGSTANDDVIGRMQQKHRRFLGHEMLNGQ